MPQEAQFGAVGQAVAPDVRLDPCLAGPEGDPDPACPVEGVVAGIMALGEVPPVTADKRIDVTGGVVACRLEVTWPAAP